jgi:hypothetical protein
MYISLKMRFCPKFVDVSNESLDAAWKNAILDAIHRSRGHDWSDIRSPPERSIVTMAVTNFVGYRRVNGE